MKTMRVTDNGFPGGNYVRKLERLVEEHPELRGRATRVNVCHDDWCTIYSGRPCNCNPDIEVLDAIA